MSRTICYLNNVEMSSSQCKLFDLYKKYLKGTASKGDFINFEGYGDMFQAAKEIYDKVMSN